MSTRNALFWLAVLGAAALAGAMLGGARGRAGVPGDRGAAGAGGSRGRLVSAPGGTLDVRVSRVVDGDTVHVRAADGARDTVRYIGIDTPESVKPHTPVQCYAKAASRRNEELVSGQSVRLVVGAEPRDRYGRLLAYVYRTADGRFVNDALVAEGFARTLTIPPNDRYAARFAARASAARQTRRGLWGAC